MYLSDFDLQQLDEQKLTALPVAQKDVLLVQLLWDLKEARDRLKANSQTSSRPPSRDLPGPGRAPDGGEAEEAAAASEGMESEAEVSDASATVGAEAEVSAVPAPASVVVGQAAGTTAQAQDGQPKKPGRQVGAPGHSRPLNLPVSATVIHPPEHCARCGQALDPEGFIARTGL